jgi:hypothetical protein
MQLRKFALWATLLMIVSLIALVWFYPSNEDFKAKNPAWNGAREFARHFRADSLQSLGDLPENPGDTILVIIPYIDFSQTDMAALKQYVGGGGTLVLADDYGYGNTVLGYLQINARFNGAPLLDPLFNYKNSYIPNVTDFTASALTQNVTCIVLNHATSLDAGSGVQIIAQTSAASFLDINNNGIAEEDEPNGPLTVAAQAVLDKGRVIILSDPSIIINSMLDMDNNSAFISNIMKSAGPDAAVMFDESHLPKENLDEAQGGLAALRGKLATPAGIALIVIIIVALALLPIWFRGKGGKHGGIFKHKRNPGQDTR